MRTDPGTPSNQDVAFSKKKKKKYCVAKPQMLFSYFIATIRNETYLVHFLIGFIKIELAGMLHSSKGACQNERSKVSSNSGGASR